MKSTIRFHIFHALCGVTTLLSLLTLLFLFVTTETRAVPIHYSVSYDFIDESTTITNFSDHLEWLRTFSTILDPHSQGGAFDPIFIAPGSAISYFNDGAFTPLGIWGLKKEAKVLNETKDKDKTWNWSQIDGKLEVRRGDKWVEVPDGEVIKVCDWIRITKDDRGYLEGTKGNRCKVDGQKEGVWHMGGPPPGPAPSFDDKAPIIDISSSDFWFFEPFMFVFLESGYIEVPETDSSNFLSVATPNAGVGCVIPEPTTICLMGFGILGLLGIVIRQRRKGK